ncbi:MAG: hypothetical protein N3E49_03950 [Bacteroidia bacterium]|nr:hypothetical protein [Bacteroidia bacterium]
MRKVAVSIVGLISLLSAQRIKGVFGLLEGNGSSYPNTGLYYRWEDENNASIMAYAGDLPGVEPFGNDLVYDPRSKLLFVVGGGPPLFTWNGSVHALDVWHSLVPLPTALTNIGARRLGVRDTLLLVTRDRAPYFTAYRINYDPQSGSLTLDSLWSPTHPLLRNLPDALLIWGDTAFIAITYNPTNFSADSLVLAINLQTRQVVGSWVVYPNPSELVRIKNNLYAACYGDFSSELRIARITPSVPTPQIQSAGYVSYGGFTTDTSGAKDTILFWAAVDGSLRAFDVNTGLTTSSPYLGLASSGAPFNPYAVLWVGNQIHMSFTNYIDTSLIVLRDPTYEPAPPHLDTLFVAGGFGGLGYPSLRRFIYVEDDTTRGLSTYLPAKPDFGGIQYDIRSGLLHWNPQVEIASAWVWDATGRLLRRESRPQSAIPLEDLPAGVYVFTAVTLDGQTLSHRFLKP